MRKWTLLSLAYIVSLALLVLSSPAFGPTGAGATGPWAPRTVVLTNSSSGHSVLAEKGDLVEVKLSSDGGKLQWTVAHTTPSSSVASTVLVPISSHTDPNGSSRSIFRVANNGTAQLQATGLPNCKPPGGCPQFVLVWQASVVVPVVDPPPPAAA